MARKHGATRWQVSDCRRRFRQRGELPSCEASQPAFAPLVVEGLLEERQVPAAKLDIAIGGASVTMIVPGAELKIYIATRPVDFRCGHDGLAAKVQAMLGLDPFSGAAFVFRSKWADRIKILVWDRTGLVLVHKRLEGCKFVWPKIADGAMLISPAMFPALFEGPDRRLVRPEEARRPQIAG
ncbi:IS66 family insertion sequence element accessory protein TnpB [Bradyrhizobium ivorense]|uniref:IS66 family insertion sequence element accessory protein TnpB n=1 Tax=Bradyrhizobium ivorense TaxID=2511166 RepID=UPI00158F0F35|nr:IS66 family insertion sequence element accessory protein TnpB [Bradyrhizobium ivorense]